MFTFSHGGNRNKQGGRVPSMWLVTLSSGLVVLWCGCVVFWRNPLRLKKERNKKKKWKEFIKPIECSDVVVECEYLAGVSVNVCGAAEAPKEQAG